MRTILFVIPGEIYHVRECIESNFVSLRYRTFLYARAMDANEEFAEEPWSKILIDKIVCDESERHNLSSSFHAKPPMIVVLKDAGPAKVLIAFVKERILTHLECVDSDYIRNLADILERQCGHEELSYPAFTVGDYKLVNTIARGGMALVCVAEKDGVRYAFKVPLLNEGHPDNITTLKWRENVRLRFEREIRLGSCGYVNTVQVVASGHSRRLNAPFLIMEYATGGSLYDVINGKTVIIEREQATKWILEIAKALKDLHPQGIVHRDIKPQNILITNGQAKLCDFGIAYEPNSDRMLMGTWKYCAPEVFKWYDPIPQMDIFSLGVTWFEILFGEHPFEGANLSETIDKISKKPPQRPKSYLADFPETLESILAKMLKKNPKERYPSGHHLVVDLERYLNGEEFSVIGTDPAFDWSSE